MCSVVGKTRQLIFLVMIDCSESDVVCEPHLDLKTTTVVVGVSIYPILDSDMGIRG